jgi:hypothetical protein
MSISAPEPMDRKDMMAAAEDLMLEMRRIDEERFKNRKPRPWHKYTDGFAQWHHARKQERYARKGGPLIYRRWVPYALMASFIAIWIPDSYKIKFLYRVDEWHDKFKFRVHCWYWRRTMEPAQYARLMEQLEANVPKSNREKSPDCPL